MQRAWLVPALGIALTGIIGVIWFTAGPTPAPSPQPAPDRADSVAAASVEGDAPKHVLWISVDTLRGDFLGTTGHPFVKTPNLDEFATEGALFERAITAAPTTLASHTSMLTGVHPHTHGVPWNGAVVDENNVTIAEILREEGFATAGVIGAYPLGEHFGLSQGFDFWSEPQVDGAAVVDRTVQWIDNHPRARSFVFMHLWDVHHPYNCPAPYDRMYREDDLEINWDHDQLDGYRAQVRDGGEEGEAVHQALMRSYAGCVSYVDAQLGRLFDHLRETGRFDDTLVIVTADHGETMNEHRDIYSHGPTTYMTATRVPLIIRHPATAGPGTRVPMPVSSVDTFATVLEALDLPIPETAEGRSLSVMLRGNKTDFVHVFSEATRPKSAKYEEGLDWVNQRKCKGVWGGLRHLQNCPKLGEKEMYDFVEDQVETTDLLASDPILDLEAERAERLSKVLKKWAKNHGNMTTKEHGGADVSAQLEALGYVEGQ